MVAEACRHNYLMSSLARLPVRGRARIDTVTARFFLVWPDPAAGNGHASTRPYSSPLTAEIASLTVWQPVRVACLCADDVSALATCGRWREEPVGRSDQRSASNRAAPLLTSSVRSTVLFATVAVLMVESRRCRPDCSRIVRRRRVDAPEPSVALFPGRRCLAPFSGALLPPRTPNSFRRTVRAVVM